MSASARCLHAKDLQPRRGIISGSPAALPHNSSPPMTGVNSWKMMIGRGQGEGFGCGQLAAINEYS